MFEGGGEVLEYCPNTRRVSPVIACLKVPKLKEEKRSWGSQFFLQLFNWISRLKLVIQQKFTLVWPYFFTHLRAEVELHIPLSHYTESQNFGRSLFYNFARLHKADLRLCIFWTLYFFVFCVYCVFKFCVYILQIFYCDFLYLVLLYLVCVLFIFILY